MSKKKLPPERPHVEVRDQRGLLLAVDKVILQEDAEGVYLIQVEVTVPNLDPRYFHSHVYTTASP